MAAVMRCAWDAAPKWELLTKRDSGLQEAQESRWFMALQNPADALLKTPAARLRKYAGNLPLPPPAALTSNFMRPPEFQPQPDPLQPQTAAAPPPGANLALGAGPADAAPVPAAPPSPMEIAEKQLQTAHAQPAPTAQTTFGRVPMAQPPMPAELMRPQQPQITFTPPPFTSPYPQPVNVGGTVVKPDGTVSLPPATDTTFAAGGKPPAAAPGMPQTPNALATPGVNSTSKYVPSPGEFVDHRPEGLS